jgi:replicative DNA helicase
MRTTIPHDWEAERLLLGALLTEPTLRKSLVDAGLIANDFHKPCHKALFEVMRWAADPSLIGIFNLCKDAALSKSLGGADYVTRLPFACPALEAADGAAMRLSQIRVRREVHLAGQALKALAADPLATTDALLAASRAALLIAPAMTRPVRVSRPVEPQKTLTVHPGWARYMNKPVEHYRPVDFHVPRKAPDRRVNV